MSSRSLQAEVRHGYLQHPLGRRPAALMVMAGMRTLATRLDQHRQNHISRALLPAIKALRAHNYQVAQGAGRVTTEFFEDFGPQLDTLSMLQFDMANADYQSAIERYQRAPAWAVIALVVSMLVMSWLRLMLIRSIVQPLQRVVETCRQNLTGNHETPIRIEGADEFSEVMRELQVMQAKLGADDAAIHQLAFYGPLTNLPNRCLLRDRLQIALDVSERSHLYGMVLMLDLNNFKTINDTRCRAASPAACARPTRWRGWTTTSSSLCW